MSDPIESSVSPRGLLATERGDVMPKAQSISTDPDVRLIELRQPYLFESPFGDRAFAMLLVACDPNLSNDERNALADAAVAANCRYACCLGIACSQWDDAIDWAYLATNENFDPPGETFVMTTWHENEPLSDTVFFFMNCTSFDDFVPTHRLIVFIGKDPGLKADILASVASELAA